MAGSYTANIVILLEKGAPEADKRWLHIDDNTSIFNRYFKEQDVVNLFQTRVFQMTRLLDLSAFHSVVAGSRIKPRVTPTGPFAQKVLIEVKCKSCNALNPETSEFCASCGARL